MSERFDELASDIAAFCADRLDAGRLDDITDEALGQVFAAVVRAYAAKVEAGFHPVPFGRNSGITPTDVAICCTAMMDRVSLQVFELAMYQDMSGLGRLRSK